MSHFTSGAGGVSGGGGFSSTILYKFRSSTSFESLPMPGTMARLFDVKRAIVKAKKLDSSSAFSGLEFDLSVKDANSNVEYTDENMLLPRGTRVVVQRFPVTTRGAGLLARIARADAGIATGGYRPQSTSDNSAGNSAHYVIPSRPDEEEFVDEHHELAALRMSTDAGGSHKNQGISAVGRGNMNGYIAGGGGNTNNNRGGSRMHSTLFSNQHGAGSQQQQHYNGGKPNADPEIREQEKAMQPKKVSLEKKSTM